MTHDPVCPVTRELSDDDSCIGCSLIAKVRGSAQLSPLDNVLAAVSAGTATTHRPPTHRQRLTDDKLTIDDPMTHDPRCPLEGNDCFDRTEHALMEESPDWCGDCGETCQCALIAQVRAEADARLHRIRAEIAALMCPDTDEGHCEACEQYREALACIDRAFTASGKSA